MVKTRPGETEKEAYLRKFREACIEVGLNPKDTESKLDGELIKKLNKKVLPEAEGRFAPVQKSVVRPNREGIRLLHKSYFHGCYPKKIKTDKQKYAYLTDLLYKGDITKPIFNDLIGVLKEL